MENKKIARTRIVNVKPKQGNVVPFTGITTLDISPDTILYSALGQLDDGMIIGWDKKGGFFFASSYADGGEVLWLMELAKNSLLDQAYK